MKLLSILVFFAGHVDAGKSTLMGHLLYLLGDVSKRSMHKYPLLTCNLFQKLRKENFLIFASGKNNTKNIIQCIINLNSSKRG